MFTRSGIAIVTVDTRVLFTLNLLSDSYLWIAYCSFLGKQ